jgi:MYXO-CTERM domain-containing protein
MTRGGQEVVAGIHSRSDCQTQAIDTRVDDYLDDIYAFLGESPTGPGCGPDGSCTTTCGFVDVDCPCAGDGFCDGSCADPAADPDCNPGCGSDAICQPDGCNMPDPDCGPACGQDGVCDPSCSVDVDCQGAAGDQWLAGGVEERSYPAYDAGCSHRPGGGARSWVLLALLGMVFSRRRRDDRCFVEIDRADDHRGRRARNRARVRLRQRA